MSKSFTLKTIRITVTLNKGTFAEGGNTKIIEGLACDVAINKPGPPQKNSATVTVWGLNIAAMRQLTMLAFRPLESQHNLMEIHAGEQGGHLALVFKGEITNASADFSTIPDPCMRFEVSSGTYPQQLRSTTLTVKGEAPADRLFAQFAHEAGYAYKNEGVTASVRNAWFPGTPIEKMIKLARDIGCDFFIDDGTAVVLPKDSPRSGNTVFLSAATGLIGYPAFNKDGIVCSCLFNPDLQYGGLIEVESGAPHASGAWRITSLNHQLSAYTPGRGSWESRIQAVPA